jgi:CRP/FNR family cyclic AMP-dependent transcriptional regulator
MARPRCWWCASPISRSLLRQHVELYDALLRLNCRRLRLMFNQFEDLNTRPCRPAWRGNCCCWPRATASRRRRNPHRPALAQEDLAQLLGASRQRVNQELKGFEREGAVRVEPTRLVVLSREKLLAICRQVR